MPDQILHERGTVRKTAGAPAGTDCRGTASTMALTARQRPSAPYGRQGTRTRGCRTPASGSVFRRPIRRGCGFLCLRFP
jgi:hypothetical protein